MKIWRKFGSIEIIHRPQENFLQNLPVKYGLLAPKLVNGLMEFELGGSRISFSGAKKMAAWAKEVRRKLVLTRAFEDVNFIMP